GEHPLGIVCILHRSTNRVADLSNAIGRVIRQRERSSNRVHDLGDLRRLRSVASNQRSGIAIAIRGRGEKCKQRTAYGGELIDPTVLPSQIVRATGRNCNLAADKRWYRAVGERVGTGFTEQELVSIRHHQSDALASASEEICDIQKVTIVIVGSDSKGSRIRIHGAEDAVERY